MPFFKNKFVRIEKSCIFVSQSIKPEKMKKAIDLKVYDVVRPTPTSNLIVRELNANVAELTFKCRIGVQIADLYTSPNECDILVGAGTCAPVNATYVKTVALEFPSPCGEYRIYYGSDMIYTTFAPNTGKALEYFCEDNAGYDCSDVTMLKQATLQGWVEIPMPRRAIK